MSDRKGKILLVTASLGAGHNAATRALEEELASRVNIQVERVDILMMLWWPIRVYYRMIFILGMTMFPRIYGLIFRLSNRPSCPARSMGERLKAGIERAVAKRLIDYIRNGEFDVIINTHFFATHMIARLIRQGKIHSRQVIAVTDVDVHRWWYSENVDQWFVSHQHTADQLAPWGIGDDRITISGMAISPKWDTSPSRQDVLDQWNIPDDKRIVLLSGGTEFVCAPVEKIATGLVAHCKDVYVMVLAGRNKKLLARLSKIAGTDSRIRPVGFTDRINELVGICCLMVTKAGGLTTAECLSQGTPMVLINPVPGQEEGNAKFFASKGAAVIASGATDIITATEMLLNDPGKLQKMQHASKNLYQPGRKIIINAVMEILKGNT